MLIKLGILAGIVVLGGMIFSNEIDSIFPSTSASVIDSLKNDVSTLGEKASESVEKRIDSSIDRMVDKTGQTIKNEISEVGDKISSEIAEAKESSQEIIQDEISDFNPFESIKDVFAQN